MEKRTKENVSKKEISAKIDKIIETILNLNGDENTDKGKYTYQVGHYGQTFQVNFPSNFQVKYNGKNVFARFSDRFTKTYNLYFDLNEDVVNNTAQKIYDAVKNAGNNNNINLNLNIDFKDIALKCIVDDDYSTYFTQAPKEIYEENGCEYEFIYLNGRKVEYDKSEVADLILDSYKLYYQCGTYQVKVNNKLQELGFDELCKERGIEVNFKYDYDGMEVTYDGDHFLFSASIALNVK